MKFLTPICLFSMPLLSERHVANVINVHNNVVCIQSISTSGLITSRLFRSIPASTLEYCYTRYPLESTDNYSATSNNMKLVHWPLMGGLAYYSWYSEETGRGRNPPKPLLAAPNVTAHPSTASVPITVLLYNGPLLCGFNVPIKG